MSNTPSNITKDTIYVCADCGSPAVTASALAGGEGACRSCGWKGIVGDLLQVPIQHTLGTPDEIKRTFHSEVRQLFAKEFAKDVLQLLQRWGFVPPVPQGGRDNPAFKKYAQLVGRYVDAVARGASNAILETRDSIETEKRMGGREVPRA